VKTGQSKSHQIMVCKQLIYIKEYVTALTRDDPTSDL